MEKPKQSLSPLRSYYLFVFLIFCIVFALIIHLALVVEINFFTDLTNNILLMFGIILFLLLFPKKIKIEIGEKIIPILKKIVVSYGRKGGYEEFENMVYEKRKLHLEQDQKIKANPKMYFLTVFAIILVTVGMILLSYFSATKKF